MRQSGESGGVGVLSLLGVAFVVLKICNVEPIASWSWWWVTAPFWLGAALVIAILALVILLHVVTTLTTGAHFTFRRRK